MGQMQSVVVPGRAAAWEVRNVDAPEAGVGEVLVKVHASGICGTDVWITHKRGRVRGLAGVKPQE
jgi:D-arabinose 1-dehydrogenase-like Zn-dependent alcohol dehydrogenase